jgi:hypothetical protein
MSDAGEKKQDSGYEALHHDLAFDIC